MENNTSGFSFRIFKKILLYSGIFIAIITSVLAAFTFFYSKEIKQYVISSINNNLDADVSVGEVEFSMLSHFPFASVAFSNVTAKEPHYLASDDTLMKAKNLSLLFNLFDVLSKNYSLKKIVLSDAVLFLKINKEGENNYEIWKKDTLGATDFKMDLENLQMENVLINYKSEKSAQDYIFKINDGTLAGNFAGDKFDISTTANVWIEKFMSEKVNFIRQKNTKVELILSVDKTTETYSIRNADISIAGLNLQVNGTIVSPEKFSLYNLTITSKDADLKSLFSVIPDEYITRIDDYTFTGKTYFKSTIKGRADKTQQPVFTIDFGTDDATIAPKNAEYVLRDSKFTGHYTSRKSDKLPVSYLSLKNIHAVLLDQPLSGNMEVENFKDPFLRFNASATAELNALSSFIKPDTLEKIQGKIVVTNAIFSGKLNDINTYISSGNLRLENVSFKFKQKPVVFTNVNGMLALNKNNLQINALSAKTPQSDFAFTGSFNNFFGFFFTKNQKLEINAAMQSEKLNLNEVMEKDASTTLNDTVYKIRFANDLVFTINLLVGEIHFNKFSATNLSGVIKLNNSRLSANALEFNAMDGNVKLEGGIREIAGDSLIVQYDASLKNLDINKLFYQMGNFGQSVITDKNLKGSLTADVQFTSHWTNTLTCNLDKISAASTLAIENGELLNFSPMLALSKYVKGADLNDIKFSTLKNSIEIKNRSIIIPAMEINSSALNITASGVHGFDNQINYHLQLLLSELTGKKVKNLNTEFGTIEDDNMGRTKLFISMKGPAANPKFSYDSKGVKEKIAVDIKKERQTLKEILKKEFGGTNGQPVKSNEEKPKKLEELQIETEEDATGNQ